MDGELFYGDCDLEGYRGWHSKGFNFVTIESDHVFI
jgi:hypothetical protein